MRASVALATLEAPVPVEPVLVALASVALTEPVVTPMVLSTSVDLGLPRATTLVAKDTVGSLGPVAAVRGTLRDGCSSRRPTARLASAPICQVEAIVIAVANVGPHALALLGGLLPSKVLVTGLHVQATVRRLQVAAPEIARQGQRTGSLRGSTP